MLASIVRKEVLTVDNTMFGEALRQVTGTLKDLSEKLSGEDGLMWFEELQELLRRGLTCSLLGHVTTITIPALRAFDVAAHFREMTKEGLKKAEVPIGFMDKEAQRLVANRTEPELKVAETTLRIHILRKALSNSQIIAELGEQTTTTWGQMYEMMCRQRHGQGGDLLVNGSGNIFYTFDTDGQIWSVSCSWKSDNQCWQVHANLLESLSTWRAGRQVISRCPAP